MAISTRNGLQGRTTYLPGMPIEVFISPTGDTAYADISAQWRGASPNAQLVKPPRVAVVDLSGDHPVRTLPDATGSGLDFVALSPDGTISYASYPPGGSLAIHAVNVSTGQKRHRRLWVFPGGSQS